MVDTHCHLDACDDPSDRLIDRARTAGVNRVMAIGMTGDSSRHALAAAERHEEVFVAVGRHPHESTGWSSAGLEELDELARHPKVRAIGEAGLDYKRLYAPRDDQRAAFEAQIDLARRHDLPLVVHTREAAEDTIRILDEQAGGLDVIVHCFSLADRVEGCAERGWYCSFAGNVTYPKAKDLQDAAARVPDHLLLAETDAPFLSPQDRRSKPNEPAFVRSTAAFLADLRRTSLDELEAVLDGNAARLFRW